MSEYESLDDQSKNPRFRGAGSRCTLYGSINLETVVWSCEEIGYEMTLSMFSVSNLL